MDFHEYFDTIFECRLVNSGDVSIPGMPPPRMPPPMPPAGELSPIAGMASMLPGPPPMGPPGMAGMPPVDFMGRPLPPTPSGIGYQHVHADGTQVGWFEWVFANPGIVSSRNEPEFTVRVPDRLCPCEIVASVEQLDPRMLMRTPDRASPAAILVKVYEHVEGRNYYSKDLVCKSNWMPLRDTMVAFTVLRGGEFKLVAEFPNHMVKVNRMIFRCYTSQPNVTVTASAASVNHMLVIPPGPPKAQKVTFVGCVRPDRLDHKDQPQYLDEEHDCLRKPEFDFDPGWKDLQDEFRRDCVLM